MPPNNWTREVLCASWAPATTIVPLAAPFRPHVKKMSRGVPEGERSLPNPPEVPPPDPSHVGEHHKAPVPDDARGGIYVLAAAYDLDDAPAAAFSFSVDHGGAKARRS